MKFYRGARIRETDFLYSYEFVTAKGVMLGEFSNRCVSAKRSSLDADGSYAQVIGTEFKAAENSAALTRLLI